ncbi:carboxymuconolactone decarboxylase family protein [Enterovirga rhinocerotis]|nr:carboxymuconolactone decarboxylase family protein [Enterovirga rhinocerotis]
MSLEPRLSVEGIFDHAPGALDALRSIRKAVEETGLAPRLLELAFLRASQINGCAFCVGHHLKDARRLGVPDRLLHLLPVWREAPDFSSEERVVLGWTETVTLLPTGHGIDDAAYREAAEALGEAGVARLTIALGYINAWNRIGAVFRLPIPSF